MIERRETNEDEKNIKSSGHWKLTENGKLFVQHRIGVQQFALVFDDKVIGFEGNKFTIKDALKSQFDYETLMKGIDENGGS
jgi:hypothetical protein